MSLLEKTRVITYKGQEVVLAVLDNFEGITPEGTQLIGYVNTKGDCM